MFVHMQSLGEASRKIKCSLNVTDVFSWLEKTLFVFYNALNASKARYKCLMYDKFSFVSNDVPCHKIVLVYMKKTSQ